MTFLRITGHQISHAPIISYEHKLNESAQDDPYHSVRHNWWKMDIVSGVKWAKMFKKQNQSSKFSLVNGPSKNSENISFFFTLGLDFRSF